MSEPNQQPPKWRKLLLKACNIFCVAFYGLALILLYVWTADKFPETDIPQRDVPSPNAYRFYTLAGSLIPNIDKIEQATAARRNATAGKPTSPAYSAVDKAALIKKNRNALDLVHEGFAYKCLAPDEPYLEADKESDRDRGMLCRIAYLLVLDGQVKAAQGDWTASVNSDIDAIRVGTDSEQRAGMSGFRAGRACEAVGRRPLWGAVDHLNAQQARTAIARLQSVLDNAPTYADALTVEQGAIQTALPKNGNIVFLSALMPNQYAHGSLKHRAELFYAPKSTIMRDLTAYTDAEIARVRQPYALRSRERLYPGDFVTWLFVGSWTNAESARSPLYSETMCRTQNALLITTFALRAFYAEHSKFPDTLSQLASAYLRAVPSDPFAANAPLQYHRVGSKYVLYSIGPDGKDDGGNPAVHVFKDPQNDLWYAQHPWIIREKTVPHHSYYIDPNDTGDVVAGINNMN